MNDPDAGYVIQDAKATPKRPSVADKLKESNVTCLNAENCPVKAPLMKKDVPKTYRVVPVTESTMKPLPSVIGPIAATPESGDKQPVKDTVYWNPKPTKPYTKVSSKQ